MTSVGNKMPVFEQWNPTLLFFRSGNTNFYNTFTQSLEKISWKFTNIKQTELPLTILRCSFEAFNLTVNGYGDHFFIYRSMKQAFAEGWERLWGTFLSKNKIQEYPVITSSNGFAAGKNLNEALLASKHELIERALLIEAWNNQKGWNVYNLKSLRCKLIVRFLKAKGWNTRLFLLSDLNLGKALTILIEHQSFGAIFDATYISSDKSPESAELKVLKSVLRALPRAIQEVIDPEWTLPIEGMPHDHYKFYRMTENVKAFDFLNSSSFEKSNLDLQNPEKIITRMIIPVSQFPAVAMSYHPDWPLLQWGRQSIKGKNLWPHPLA